MKNLLKISAFVLGFLMLFSQNTTGTRAEIIGKQGNLYILNKGSADGVNVGMEGYFWMKFKSSGKYYNLNIAKFVITRVEEHKSYARIIKLGEGFHESDIQWATFMGKLTPPPSSQPSSSEDVFSLIERGISAYRAGNLQQAKDYFRRALRIDPTNRAAQRGLEMVLEAELEATSRRSSQRKPRYPSFIQAILDKAQKVYKNSQGYWEAVFYNDTVMVYIPEGEFLMGQTDEEKQWLIKEAGKSYYEEWYSDETPAHKVYLDGFWISKYEVTFAQYDRFCEETGREKPDDEGWGRGNRPVINVSWNDALAYTKWLSQKTGLPFRLPTEAEWEKACRGTDGRRYPWGNHSPYYNGKWYANFEAYDDWFRRGEDGYEYTAPVGSYPEGASPYGLLDMAGNVWEWVADWYDKHYYSKSPYRNPKGPATGSNRVVRGGCWLNYAHHIRCADRGYDAPSGPAYDVGFRPAMDSQ